MYSELPVSNNWIEHLDILDAIRINQLGTFKSIEDIYTTMLNGIAVVGIKKDSEEYNQAKDILQKNGLNFNMILVVNALNPDLFGLTLTILKKLKI